MKEIMEKMFDSQYFVVILFAAIGILALLFIIVLIMAVRDAKKNKKAQEMTKEADSAGKMAEVAFASVNDSPVKIEVDPSVNNSSTKQDDVVEIKSTNNETFDDVKVDAPVGMAEENKSIFPEIDVDKPKGDTFDKVNGFDFNMDMNKADSTPEPVLKPQQPEQFSSIYVTPSETPKKEEPSSGSNDIPDFSDIPMPTPIQVVNSASIIDSSKKDDASTSSNDVSNNSEEYTLK